MNLVHGNACMYEHEVGTRFIYRRLVHSVQVLYQVQSQYVYLDLIAALGRAQLVGAVPGAGAGSAAIGLYFSAHWNLPSQVFASQLVKN